MNENNFNEYLDNLNIKLNKTQLNQLESYRKILLKYNQTTNLTRIVEKEEVYLKHFFDSICLIKSKKIEDNIFLCDVGTGAGFPGVVIAIIYPNIKVDLIESNGKKCVFLNGVKEELNLENVHIIQERIEQYAKNNREKYDVVTARAVANLKVLFELSIALVKEQGYFVPLKAEVSEELKNSTDIIKKLGCSVEELIEYYLPIEDSKRTLVVIKKLKKTDLMYPREYSKIIKDKK